ncbi:hypothetical protein OH76DRAFT_1482130 [Lentinus brumalis]|uniref:Uncharacterized protein n=1 Tax=Lentinus brumalis TaxID=2498619 RepID=A0A371DDU5_9APHY|nr:hypothetical protein OH76DRAFT_1482130 [Polyporus brumalis]
MDDIANRPPSPPMASDSIANPSSQPQPLLMASDSEPPTPIDLRIYRPIHAKLRPAATHAFGFLLGPQIRRRWALWFYEHEYGDKLSTMTPEEADEEIEDFECITSTMLPSLLYILFPNLPRLRNRILPTVDGHLVPKHYVFVLRDNATRAGLNAKLNPEDIGGLRKKLGLAQDQQPDWYRIDAGAK